MNNKSRNFGKLKLKKNKASKGYKSRNSFRYLL